MDIYNAILLAWSNCAPVGGNLRKIAVPGPKSADQVGTCKRYDLSQTPRLWERSHLLMTAMLSGSNLSFHWSTNSTSCLSPSWLGKAQRINPLWFTFSAARMSLRAFSGSIEVLCPKSKKVFWRIGWMFMRGHIRSAIYLAPGFLYCGQGLDCFAIRSQRRLMYGIDKMTSDP